MRHRTAPLAVIALCIISATAQAQDVVTAQAPPRVEVFAGIGPVFDADGHESSGTDSRWGVLLETGLAVNLNRRTSIVLDNVSFGRSNDAWIYGFTVGPRVRFGGDRRLTGFAQTVVGLVRWNPDGWSSSTGVALSNRSTALQGAVAVGLDYRISRRVTWRIVQVEQRRRFGDDGRNTTTTSTGVVFGLGGR